jgi:hypothetical protein
MAFDDDLKAGHRSEDRVLDIIRKKYPEAERIEGKHSPYDIIVPERRITVEVKGDYVSQKTNNIVIEVNHPIGKQSGLLVTTADWWVHDTGKELIWIKPKRIEECITVHNFPSKDIKGRGDRHPKRVYLIPVDTYRTFAWKPYDHK